MINMQKMDLEFRGIPLTALESYFEELDGKQVTDDFPIIFDGGDWKGEIRSEEELQIASTYRVNAVHISFSAKEKSQLDELITKYRKKTTRVGMAPAKTFLM